MTETAQRLKSSLSELSSEDRAELARFLISSLDPDVDNDAEAAWEAELQRRGQEIESGQTVGEPSEQVFARLLQKYK